MKYDKLTRGMFRYGARMLPKPKKLSIDGDLKEWDAAHMLPDFTEIDGGRGFAQIYAGWDEDGLTFALNITKKKEVLCLPKQYLKGDEIFLWIDTRDARDSHRASGYCHYYRLYARGGVNDNAFAVQLPIMRAQAQSPKCESSAFEVASVIGDNSYSVELSLPASALHGYDPAVCSRIGLSVQVVDHENGEQFWPVPPPFQFWEDPSYWATVELVKG